MERKEMLGKLQNIFRDVFDNNELEISDESSSDDIDEWDSLAHIQLIVAIEKEFKIKFTSKDMLSWNNVGDMINSLINNNC